MARIFHRNLFSFLTSTLDTNVTTTTFPTCSNFQDCYDTFPDSDRYPLPPLPPPLPPISVVVSPDTTTSQGVVHISPLVIIIVIVLASIFLLVSYYAIVIKYCTFWNNRNLARRSNNNDPRHSDNDEGDVHATHALVRENEGRDDPVIDHPIWLISTVGLHQSIINSISTLRYKKEDGLIDGTDCSVCLSEFQEDETLRILPKCKHAFHVDCIDTWLRSHINCPLCRAGIVANSGRQSLASNEASFGHSRRVEPVLTVDMDSSDIELGNSSQVIEIRDDNSNVDRNNDQIKVEVDFNSIIRRSFSMDFFRSSNFRNMGVNHLRNSSNSGSGSARVIDSSGSSSITQPLGPHPIKRSYSWSERVFWSSRNLNNGNRDISP